MNQDIFKKFTENLKKTLLMSEKLAAESKSATDTDHLLLSLATIKGTLSYEILLSLKITPDRIMATSPLLKRTPLSLDDRLTPDTKKAVEMAVSIASQNSHFAIDSEHLLLALTKEKSFKSYFLIDKLGVNPSEVVSQIEFVFNTLKENKHKENEDFILNNLEENLPDNEFISPFGPLPGIQTATKTKKESLLNSFASNITIAAQEGKLDAVIGRDLEIERIIQILSRRTKNNPILIGEPGVGKSSIIEALAQRIVDGKVPVKLIGKEIFSLDMGSVVAGTMYRGQFEGRIKKIIEEIRRRGNVILFVDEIHTIVGAGSTEGSIDAANILKPMLAKGELRMIGATTFDEYKKNIEKDPAFERRFQPVKIAEPSVEETYKILQGIKSKYEEHHGVKYTDDALSAAAYLSKRYINDRFLPDKAIDLIDEAAAAASIQISRELVRMLKIKKELREILKQKEEYIIAEKYKEATLMRSKEIILENKIQLLKSSSNTNSLRKIEEQNIAEVVSKWTGVPVSNMNLQEKKRFLSLGSRIKKQIIGQDQAIEEIVKAIKRARVGISNPNRPMGTFIFLGPTGVGKTELARVLSEELLGNRNTLVKIDMSEFMERHNVSRLVGAPAGYVGYEEGGKLTEIVRKNPYSIILLDEIEKANPEVFNILLQVMEDGELTDAKGRKVDFKNTIIIMTSNLGTDVLTKQAAIGFNNLRDTEGQYTKLEQNILDTVQKHFKPEFINRLDKIIIFKPLNKKSIRRIVDLELSKLQKRLGKDYILEVTPKAKDYLTENGFDPNYGARPVRKLVADTIENDLSELILKEELKKNSTVLIDVFKEKITIKSI